MIEMVRKEIQPAIDKYLYTLADTAEKKVRILGDVSACHEKRLITHLSELLDRIDDKTENLEKSLFEAERYSDPEQWGIYLKDHVIPAMQELRKPCDEAEILTDRNYWPFPTYGDIFFGVR